MPVRNYAAQAIRSMNDLLNNGIGRGDTKTLRSIERIIRVMSKAVHFSLPEGGRLIGDDLKGIKGMPIRLPYPVITIEYSMENTIPQKGVPTKFLILAEEGRLSDVADATWGDDDVIVVTALFKEPDNGIWVPMPAGMAIPHQWDSVGEDAVRFGDGDDTATRVATQPFPVLPRAWEAAVAQYGLTEGSMKVAGPIQYSLFTLMDFLEALSCSNVNATTIQHANEKANAKRLKNGKLPLLEIKTLTIDVSPSKAGSSLTEFARLRHDRNSPRQHLRRGHIRRYANGHRVWVNSCIVGAAEQGVVLKNYALTNQ